MVTSMKRTLAALAIGIVLAVVIVGINSGVAQASNVCWTKSAEHTFGSWWTGFGQQVSDTTTFCANHVGGQIVYRATTVGFNTIACWENSKSQTKIAGAADGTSYYVEWQDVVHFTCPTNLPGYYIHPTDSIAIYAVSDGTYDMYWHN